MCKSKRAPPPAPPSLFGGQYGRPRPPAGAMYAPPVCAHVCVCVLRQAPICAPCLCAWPVSACVCTCVHLFPSVPTPPAWYWFVILPALFVSDAHVRVCMSPQPTRGPDFVLSCSLLSPSVFFHFLLFLCACRHRPLGPPMLHTGVRPMVRPTHGILQTTGRPIRAPFVPTQRPPGSCTRACAPAICVCILCWRSKNDWVGCVGSLERIDVDVSCWSCMSFIGCTRGDSVSLCLTVCVVFGSA